MTRIPLPIIHRKLLNRADDPSGCAAKRVTGLRLGAPLCTATRASVRAAVAISMRRNDAIACD